MAIDPSIALQVRPPQDLTQSLANIYALKNAGQQQQLNAQSLQQGQYQLNAAGRAQADDEATRAAFSGNTQIDPATGAPTLNRAGALSELYKTAPTSALKYQQQFTQQDAANQKAAADYQKTQLENAKAHVDFVGQLLQGVKDQPSYTAALQTAMQSGIVKPGELPPVYDPNLVQQHLANALTQKDAIAAKQKELELAQTTQRDTVSHQDRLSEQGIQQQNANSNKARLGLEQKKFAIEQAATAGPSATGDAYLQSVTPSLASVIKATANGDVAIPPAGTRNKQAQAIREGVFAYDPTYTDARYKAKQTFKTGNDSQSVVGLSTAMEHLDRLKTNSDKLGFSPLIDQGVSTESARYGNDAKLFAQEAGKLIKSGVVTEGEYRDLKAGLMSSRASIRSASIDELTNLMSGKVNGVFQKYKTATGQDLPADKFFDKNTQQRLQRFGVVQSQGGDAGGGMIRAIDQNGNLHEAPVGTPLPAGWKAQ